MSNQTKESKLKPVVMEPKLKPVVMESKEAIIRCRKMSEVHFKIDESMINHRRYFKVQSGLLKQWHQKHSKIRMVGDDLVEHAEELKIDISDLKILNWSQISDICKVKLPRPPILCGDMLATFNKFLCDCVNGNLRFVGVYYEYDLNIYDKYESQLKRSDDLDDLNSAMRDLCSKHVARNSLIRKMIYRKQSKNL
jgi:hypothetical protein